MGYKKFGQNLHLEGKYSVQEAADILITELNETGISAANKSVKDHIEKLSASVQSLSAVTDLYQGNLDCSTNPNYPAATQDQYWRVSVAGKVGGASGTLVEVGDMIFCIATNAGGTEASVGTSFQITQANINRPYLLAADDAYTTDPDDNAAGLSSCITLANEIKADLNTHYADQGTGALDSAIALANALKATYNTHVTDAGGGTEEHTAELTNTEVAAADATDLSELITLTTELLTDYDAHDNDAEQGTPVVHQATEAGDASLASAAAPTDLHECVTRLNDLKAKLNTHVADGTAHTNGDSGTEATADAAYVEEHISAQSAIATADATDLTTLKTLIGACLTSYNTHDDDAELADSWVYHIAGEAGDATLASTASPTTLAECITRANDLKAKINTHVADGTAHTAGDTSTVASANAAVGAALDVTVSGAASGDHVTWAILDSGTGTVTGVSAVAGTDKVTFTFSGDPGNDAIISYAVFKQAAS